MKSPAQAGLFFTAMDGGYAGNAGAFSGGWVSVHHPEKRKRFCL